MSAEQKSTHITTNKYKENIRILKHEILKCCTGIESGSFNSEEREAAVKTCSVGLRRGCIIVTSDYE
jgi:hypothetical protein